MRAAHRLAFLLQLLLPRRAARSQALLRLLEGELCELLPVGGLPAVDKGPVHLSTVPLGRVLRSLQLGLDLVPVLTQRYNQLRHRRTKARRSARSQARGATGGSLAVACKHQRMYG
jgi:hypothetical protein